MTKPGIVHQKSAPFALEPMESEDYRKHLVHSRTEILFILRALQRKGALVSAYLDQGVDSLLTSILAVDEGGLLLDVSPDAKTNRRALASDQVQLVTWDERVKVQFSTGGLRDATHEGQPAFRTDLPESVLRLERREYYRLAAPTGVSLKCYIPIRDEDGSERTLGADVVDISCSGVAVVAPPEGVLFAPHMRFENCRIDLPEAGSATMTLEVRNVFEVTLRSGARVRRAGCQFLDMPGATRNAVQRYITTVDRERRARQISRD